MAQRSLRDFCPIKRRKLDDKLGCSNESLKSESHIRSPGSFSRGKIFAELGRQKALTSPVSRVVSKIGSGSSKTVMGATEGRTRMTAKRRLSMNTSNDTSANVLSRALEPEKGPRLLEFGSIEFESPTKKKGKSNLMQQSCGGSIDSPGSDDLPLPQSYKDLSEKFHSTDTVVTMLQRRNEICTFLKLKKAVEVITRRQFEEHNLAQIKMVYPSAYIFRQQKDIPGYFNGDGGKYQLTIECNGKEDGVRPSSSSGSSEQHHLNPADLVYRRRIFKKNLYSIIRKHHKEFLAHLDPPLDIPDHKVLHWHQEFLLEEVPEIEAAELPAVPFEETCTTPNRILSKFSAKASSGMCTTPNNMLLEYDAKNRVTPVHPSLKGISTSLIEKIKEREASKAAAYITRPPMKEKKLGMLQELPDMIRILRVLFSGKMAALSWEDVVNKISESHPSLLSTDYIEENLVYLLNGVGKGWITSVTVRKKKYIKIIDRNLDMKTIFSRITELKTLLQ